MSDTQKYNDLVDDEDAMVDAAKIHFQRLLLWPKQWTTFLNLQRSKKWDFFDWKIFKFNNDQINMIPQHKGIYSFIIKPEIALHPACSYIMYIGKSERSLKDRFKEYLREKTDPKARPKIKDLLKKYDDYLYFCCTEIPADKINEIETKLISAYMPPCNRVYEASIRRVVNAL